MQITEEPLQQKRSNPLKEMYPYLVKYRVIILLLIPLILCIFLRLQSDTMPFTDASAQNAITSYVKGQIRTEVSKAYPNLPSDFVEKEVEKKFNEVPKEQFLLNKKQLSQQYKQIFKDENGQTYLQEMDPYFWTRGAKNIIEKGYPGDEKINGTIYDTYSLAPYGKPVPFVRLHYYMIAWVYWILSPFGVSLIATSFYLPVFLVALAVLFGFLLARKIAGNWAGFFAGIFIASQLAFLHRTMAGFNDTDPYGVLFPIIILYALIKSFDDSKFKYLFVSLSAILTGLYSYAWTGWATTFYFIVAFLGIYFIYLLFKKQSVKEHIIKSVIYVLLTALIVLILKGASQLYWSTLSPILFLFREDVAATKIWPNVLTTVAEQSDISYVGVIQAIGGWIIVLICILGLIYLFKKNMPSFIIYSISSIIMFFAVIKGFRYTLLLVPFISILLGSGIKFLMEDFTNKFSSWIKIKSMYITVLVLIIGFVSLFPTVSSAYNYSIISMPLMDDGWYLALKDIDTNSSQNSIITSWWDFGHWFKYIGNRPSTFDGASQNTPQAHWVGRLLLTNDEHEAVNILRMLDCGGNRAYDEINKILKDDLESVKLVKEIIMQDKTTAINTLNKYNISEETIQYTHCNPPEAYLITSEDMVGKSPVWGHFGLWDFNKAKIINMIVNKKSPTEISLVINISLEEATKASQEIPFMSNSERNSYVAAWPGYASSLTKCDGTLCVLTVGNNKYPFTFNLTTLEIKSPVTDKNLFQYISIMDNGKFTKKYLDDPFQPISLSLIKRGEDYYAIVSSFEIGDSMFNRLFYFNGEGLSHFELFTYQHSNTGGDVYIWRVKWI